MRHVIQIVVGRGYATDLKDRMDKMGISQNMLAEEMGLTPSQVSRWFTTSERRVSPSMESAEAIEMALLKIQARLKKSKKK